jgi:transcriptional regulator with XRE-family HTH domain
MVGEELRRLRKAAGLTQVQLAAAAGVTQAFIAMLERGARTTLPADKLFKIAAALGVGCEHFAPFFAEPVTKKRPKLAAKTKAIRKGKK